MIQFINKYLSDWLKTFYVPIWESKCWGRVWHRFNDEQLNESLLEVNKDWQCSIHWHTDRYNCFICINAIIGVEDFGPAENEPTLISTTIIKEGESLTIFPKRWHRFYVIQSGRLVEIYWTTNKQACKVNDINRFDVGGKRINS